MKKNVIWIIIVIIVIAGVAFVGYKIGRNSSNEETPEPTPTISETPQDSTNNSDKNYVKLTKNDLQKQQVFHLTNVEDKGDTLLLKGVIYTSEIATSEIEKAKAGTPIEIDGETYTYAIDEHGDELLRSGKTEVRFWQQKTESELANKGMYYLAFSGQANAWRKTDMYREVEIDKNIICQTFVGDMKKSTTKASDMFTNYTETIPTNLGLKQWFDFDFENGKCTKVEIYEPVG